MITLSAPRFSNKYMVQAVCFALSKLNIQHALARNEVRQTIRAMMRGTLQLYKPSQVSMRAVLRVGAAGAVGQQAVHACRQGLMGLGVADGVYEWREKGVDAGEFSRLLMHTALDTIEGGQPDVLKGEAGLRASGKQREHKQCVKYNTHEADMRTSGWNATMTCDV